MMAILERGRVATARTHRLARESLFWALLNRQRRWLKWMLGLFFASTVSGLMTANLVRNMVDQGLVDRTAHLAAFVPRITIWAGVSLVLGFATAQVTARVSYTVEYDMRLWLYTRVLSTDAQRLQGLSSGQLVTRVLTDLQLMERILAVFPIVVGLIPYLLAVTIFLAFLSPTMAALSVMALPINLWLLSRFRKPLWGLSWAELNERAEVASAIDEPVRGIRVVKAFGRENTERAKVAAAALKAYRFAMTRVRLLARYDFVMKLVPLVVAAMVLAAGAHLLHSKRLSLGAFVLAFGLVSQITLIAGIFDELASAWQYLRSAQVRLAEVLAMGVRPMSDGRALPVVSTGLHVEGVDVAFDGHAILSGLEMECRPGELTVVLGAPGSGKSTMAGVMAGLIAPTRGRVVIDGVDLDEVDPAARRMAVRVVSEDSVLFATTLRRNMELGGGPDTDDDAIAAALRAAAAEDVVAQLPGGLDAQVGDRGLTLSGGQRQRLALARALVSPPRVLVLDDALAAVNPALEIEILERLRMHAAGIVIVCVTRRTGPLRLADHVVELPAPSKAPAAHTPTTNAASSNTDLLKIVSALEVDDVSPGVAEAVTASDDPPRMRQLLRPFGGVIALGVLLVFIQSGTLFAPEVLFGQIADLVEHGTRQADHRALALVGVAVVFAGSSYFLRLTVQRFVQGLIYVLRRRTFHRLSRLGIDFYDREQPGQVAAKVVNDLDVLLNFSSGPAFQVLTLLAQFLAGMALILVISPTVAPVIGALAAIVVVATAIQLPVSTRAWNWARDELGRVAATFEEDFGARHEIKNLGAEAIQTTRFIEAIWERRRARWWVAVVNNSYASLLNFVGIVVAAHVLLRAGNLVLVGTLSVGTALTLRLLASSATQPLQALSNMFVQFLNAKVSWDRLQEPFTTPILPVPSPDARPCPHLEGEIAFENVEFAYPHTGRTVLHGVTFTIPRRTVTGLVGYTGAGKSSIAKLLTRVYDPVHGVVRVDGFDIRTVDLDSFRSRFGIVPQDAFVFRGTVASNIGYGRPDATEDEIAAAARACGAFDVLDALPGGLAHPVEEEGRNLTAAQRQLIALARAWIADPDILVLDEATSSLDADTEERVLDALASMRRTVIMVTHRQNVAERSELIVVLDGGRVVEQGAAAEVIGAGGHYDKLWATEGELAPVGANGRVARGARIQSSRRRRA